VKGYVKMSDILQNIDISTVLYTVWTAVLLPALTYVATQVGKYTKAKKIQKYTDILYKNVVDAVKDVYETTVKDIKGTEGWDEETQEQVKEIAKTKAIQAMTTTAYQVLKEANDDFDEYLDSLIGTALYDLKNT
jgi:uncharacterized protein (UPF0305 family)